MICGLSGSEEHEQTLQGRAEQVSCDHRIIDVDLAVVDGSFDRGAECVSHHLDPVEHDVTHAVGQEGELADRRGQEAASLLMVGCVVERTVHIGAESLDRR